MKEETARERLMARRARERAEDQEAGRPQRGLFTGRGRRQRTVEDIPERAASTRHDHELDENFDDAFDDDFDDDFEPQTTRAFAERAPAARPRTGAKRSVMSAIRQIPSYIRLLFGLMGDRRVSKVDRFFVVAAAAYIISPLDFIPDLIPFFGQVDDVFLLVTALQRLVDNTGRRILLQHWRGDPEDLSDVNLTQLVSAAGFFLPGTVRQGLRRLMRRRKG